MDLIKLIIKPAQAQNAHPLGGLSGTGNIGLEGGSPAAAGNLLAGIISSIIGLMTVIAGIWFSIQIILAGFGFISAEGDPQKLEKARKQITQGILGLVIVVGAVFLASLVGDLFGIEFLNIAEQINNLSF